MSAIARWETVENRQGHITRLANRETRDTAARTLRVMPAESTDPDAFWRAVRDACGGATLSDDEKTVWITIHAASSAAAVQRAAQQLRAAGIRARVTAMM